MHQVHRLRGPTGSETMTEQAQQHCYRQFRILATFFDGAVNDGVFDRGHAIFANLNGNMGRLLMHRQVDGKFTQCLTQIRCADGQIAEQAELLRLEVAAELQSKTHAQCLARSDLENTAVFCQSNAPRGIHNFI